MELEVKGEAFLRGRRPNSHEQSRERDDIELRGIEFSLRKLRKRFDDRGTLSRERACRNFNGCRGIKFVLL